MKTKVSVIVPVYNVQDYVLRCLESLKNQKYEEIEIIIVDDGSTDKSGKICDRFVKNEKRARVFHKKNGGLSDARNYGIGKSSGELIAFVDSDDYVREDYIGRMVETLDNDKSDIVICGYNKELPKSEVISGFDAVYNCLIRQDNVDIVAWNKLYKKELFIENGILFPKGEKHEDLLTIYKVVSKAKKVSYIDEALYCYEDREGSIMNAEKKEEKLHMRERAAKEAIAYFRNFRDDDLSDMAKVSLVLAKYAYIDAALKGEIDEEYYGKNISWLKQNMKKIKKFKYLTKKLRLYNVLNMSCGGFLYRTFRKFIIH